MPIRSSQYHRQTSYWRNQMSGHSLDWANQPSVYKTYRGIPVIPLPEDPPLSEVFLSQILREQGPTRSLVMPSQEELSKIFKLTFSLTAKAATANGAFYYRSVASAGALYPTELYLATPGLSGLKEGLYHYSIARQGLSPLREGNFFSFLQQATLWPDGFFPGVTFLFSAIFFRSAWKYRERAFRYHLLDTGHLIENLLLALGAHHLSSSLTYDFDDSEINRFLGLDPSLEGTLALVSLPGPSSEDKGRSLAIPDLIDSFKGASRVSQRESSYPLIQEIYEAGGETNLEQKPLPPWSLNIDPEPIEWAPIISPESWPEKLTYAEAVSRRRSKRNFIPEPLASRTFDALLEGLSLDIPGLLEVPEYSNAFLSLGLLTGPVEGVLPGFYQFNKRNLQVRPVKHGQLINPMAQICLDQMWLANAALHFLFIANLEALDHHWGPRGYRYAMMTAGRLGERLYLIASALGLGCCGIGAFYDQEAANLLGLDEANRLLYLVAVGSLKRKASI
jgi:SagB-type dehydrogenase family enzyme